MLALPIQAHIAQLWGCRRDDIRRALCRRRRFVHSSLFRSHPSRSNGPWFGRSMLPGGVLVPVVIAGTAWGAMNLACVWFFSYAPVLMVAQGSSSTAAASLTSLAIWFTILGHSIRADTSFTALGRPIRSHCRLLADCCRGRCAVCRGGPPNNLLHGIRSFCRSHCPERSFRFRLEGARPARSRGRICVFYTCFYALTAVGHLAAGYLQDVWDRRRPH